MATRTAQDEGGAGGFLRAGIAAFKQGDYTLAIQHFQLAEAGANGDELLQIQGWLVRAYSQNRRHGEARALCETLLRCDRPTVQAWAQQVLDQLPTPDPSPPAIADSPPPQFPDPQQPPRQSLSPLTQSGPPSPPQPERRPPPRDTPLRTRRPTTRRRRDATPIVLSVIAHGSVSLFASLILWLLLPDSTIATLLGLARSAIPILILCTTQDPLAKDNAREATNYAITTFVLAAVALVVAIPLAIVGVGLLNNSPGLLIVLAIPLVGYLLLLSLFPLFNTVLCCLNGGQVARYPRWLIFHLV